MMILHKPELFNYTPRHILFADTGAEPEYVYSHVARLEDFVKKSKGDRKFYVIRSKRGFINETSQNMTYPPYFTASERGKKNGILKRQCTGHFKITPLQAKIREILGYAHKERLRGREKAKLWLGISTDEAQRAKPSIDEWLELEYPLLELQLSRQACELYNSMNFEYKINKSACFFCPYIKHKEWVRRKEEHPEEFAKAVQFDKDLRKNKYFQTLNQQPYLHSSCLPLDEAVEKDQESFNLGFEQECCGVCEL